MTSPGPPEVDCERHHPTLKVADVRLAFEYYSKKLGFRLDFAEGDTPDFAGVSLGKAQVFLSRGSPSTQGCSVYFVVGDADELHEFHRSNGVAIAVPPADRPYGLRDYTVRDLDGYSLTFGHYIYTAGPPVKIERVEVPVRIEKRLAALLRDLAEHKRMSIDGCLEEILLHTCEPFGDGVASPHTRRTLRYIQELKKKHGIDYDCHAGYRFVEG